MSTIHQFALDGRLRNQPSQPWLKRKENLDYNWCCLQQSWHFTGYGFGSYYYSRGQMAERYEAAARRALRIAWNTKYGLILKEIKHQGIKLHRH